MPKKITLLLAIITLAFCAACSSPSPTSLPPTAIHPTRSIPPTVVSQETATPEPAGPITIRIIHTNDLHGHFEGETLQGGDGTVFVFGGIANVMGTVARLKQESSGNTITLDAGDFWQGTFASNRDEGRTIINAMNMVGYDALTLGNHDFDHGQAVVKARAIQAQFPFLAANLVEQSTNKPPSWVKPYVVKQFLGLRVGIIGLANSGTPVISKASNTTGLAFARETDALRQLLPQVKDQSDLILVLAHEGIDVDQRLAEQVPGIDVIVSGHTHVEQRQSKLVGKTIIVHAGYKAQYVGRLDLTIDRATKKIVDYTKSNEPVAAVSNKALIPEQVKRQTAALVADARDEMQRPIGETSTDLIRQYTSDGRTTGEYPLGNLVVDAMLAANQAGSRPPDIAMYNQGVRANIQRGKITFGMLYEVLPFDNVLAALDLSGAQIKAILEIATSCPRVNTLVAGMSFVYDCSKPQGKRVSSILIRGKPLELDTIYRVQTVDYLVGGGDGQTPFTSGKDIAYGDPMVEVVADYVTKHSPLDLHSDGRIVAAGQ